ncbi:phosphoribosylamine--glycine ligase [Saccharicrinis sp. FJH62]|uniref:phosphoribosylamine--glycine ligase n=1 Tax=Saccharicrinis sp. FJH62 TaxID=3344657 RepID=UPI0035D44F82
MGINILLLGSGGREHAMAWKISQSDKTDELYILPGNAGTSEVGTNVSMQMNDFAGIKELVLTRNINLVVVGPEAPLVDGIADFFASDNDLKSIGIVGPGTTGATLEGSKEFAKEFMIRHNIPTAAYKSFTKETLNDGVAFLKTLKAPYVLKADGLAAGKGVLILNYLEEATQELEEMLSGKFGDASSTVVIEEFLSGVELSVFVMTDGESYKILPEAKDYKRIGEGDTGLNTGGMGAISPVPFADKAFMAKIEDQIVKPTVEGLKKDNISYRGFIFLGLINCDGEPKVIEYNVRMGDPETEAVMLRIKSDFVELLQGVAEGNLGGRELEFDERTAVTVMMVAGGYPEAYNKGDEISGIDDVEESVVFHAGTKFVGDKVVTNGGRVIAVSSYGTDMKSALAASYKNAGKINFQGKYYRKDLGFDL